MLAKGLMVLFLAGVLLGVSTALSWSIMLYGWGVTPVSWPFIIMGTMLQLAVGLLTKLLGEINA